MGVKNIILIIAISLFIIGCNGGNKKKSAKEVVTTNASKTKMELQEPEIPVMIEGLLARSNYYVEHFWDNFDFTNSDIIKDTATISYHYSRFAQALPMAKLQVSADALYDMMEKAEKGGKDIYEFFFFMTEFYLYSVNSPLRYEELFIPVLNHYISSTLINNIDKERPKYQLKQASKNRLGTPAADFAFITSNNKESTLYKFKSPYTLIFFSNLGCPECARTMKILSESPYTGPNSKLKVLTIFPDKESEGWDPQLYPKHWVSAYDKGQMITKKELYDLRAIPMLYLLDENKNVILKDPTLEYLMQFLYNNSRALQ